VDGKKKFIIIKYAGDLIKCLNVEIEYVDKYYNLSVDFVIGFRCCRKDKKNEENLEIKNLQYQIENSSNHFGKWQTINIV